MSSLTLKTVNFHNQNLITLEKDNQYYVAMKPICENIGLAWNAQFERLQRDEVLNSTIRMIRTVGSDNKAREMLCIPIQYLNGWLFGVDTNRIKDENIKQKLITYKTECYQVLFNYWNDGIAINPRRITISVEQQAHIRMTIAKICKSNSVHYQSVYTALQKQFNIPRYDELLASDFDKAMEFIHSFNLPTGNQQSLYEVLSESYQHLTAYAQLIKSLGHLPFFDDLTANRTQRFILQHLADIEQLSAELNLRNAHGRPMIEANCLNFYSGNMMTFR